MTVSMWPVLGVSGAPLCRLAANIETADTRGTQRGYLAIEEVKPISLPGVFHPGTLFQAEMEHSCREFGFRI